MDGTGKTTQIEMIYNYLKSKGEKVIKLREPGSTKFGEQLRKILEDKETNNMTPESIAMMFAIARNELIQEELIPSIKKGYIVLLDRFVQSSIAYNGNCECKDIEFIETINKNAFKFINEYDVTSVILLFDPIECINRKKDQKELDRCETNLTDKLYQEKVKEGYTYIVNNGSKEYENLNTLTIMTSGSKEQIFEIIKKHILETTIL